MINKKGVMLLQKYINDNYKNISLEDVSFNNDEFYYEFKMDNKISENDFINIEKELFNRDSSIYIKLLRISGVYYKGNKANEMIDRISVKAFNSKDI